MSLNKEPLPQSGQEVYFQETQEIIDSLAENPKQDLRCSHGDNSPAVGVYEVPGGCVALPGVQTQQLCSQHVITNGSFEGMSLIVDLSIGGEWSRRQGEIPDYFIDYEPETEHLALISIIDEPESKVGISGF